MSEMHHLQRQCPAPASVVAVIGALGAIFKSNSWGFVSASAMSSQEPLSQQRLRVAPNKAVECVRSMNGPHRTNKSLRVLSAAHRER